MRGIQGLLADTSGFKRKNYPHETQGEKEKYYNENINIMRIIGNLIWWIFGGLECNGIEALVIERGGE